MLSCNADPRLCIVAYADVQEALFFCRWEGGAPQNLISAATPGAFKDIIQQDRLVVVNFFAPWCMACRRLFPAVLKIAENNPDVLFVKVR